MIEVDLRLKSELLLFGFCTFHIIDICEILQHRSVLVVSQSDITISLAC